MKIGLLHFSQYPPAHYGGIERVVLNLAKEYRRLGHEVILLGQNSTANNSEAVASGPSPSAVASDYTFYPLPPDYKKRPVEDYLPTSIDFLHAHEPLPIEPKMPYLITIHGNGHPQEHYWPNTNFLSQSHARNHAAQYYIYNGLDTAHFPSAAPSSEDAQIFSPSHQPIDEPYVVFLAKATWRVKNLRTCIDFANDARIRLEVIGGYGRNSKYVRYHGMLGEKDGKLEILARARALLYLTNWDEPCAVAPLESLACGVPVISSPNGCMPEMVEHNKTGFVCSTYDDIFAAWRHIDKINRADCKKSIEEKFNVRTQAASYLKLYQRILTQGPLDHQPHYNFNRQSISYVFKPTWRNKLLFSLRGKI